MLSPFHFFLGTVSRKRSMPHTQSLTGDCDGDKKSGNLDCIQAMFEA